MATDPYQWARDFAASQYARAGQKDNDRTQMLLNMFTEEAARQRPYVAMPGELAMTEAKAAIQRRYQLMRDADKAAAKKKAGVSGTGDPELDAIMADAGITPPTDETK